MRTATQPRMENGQTVDVQLQTHSIRVERKHITFDLRENPRGRFLRITEEVGGRRDAVIVPASGLEEFRQALDKIIAYAKSLPEKP
ncbi:MAG: PUR family DNA/RNA-binding protein [Verrucomicrobiae bacterium]|nr:PUR family DNA/RNA-binding protein [Verrucomicrobiae bacterium]MDW8343183.1 PUR family DNA/RNA-binding protein [Verrucomicrobiae bacterium]